MLNKILMVLLILINVIIGQNDKYLDYRKTSFAVGTQFGMYGGVGGNISLLTSQFADNFPFTAKLSVGLTYLDAGDPLEARRIFINNNTNGIPEKNGKTWNFTLDFLRRYTILNLKRNYFYAGPRYIMFTGNFNFIGGNEDFDVTSNQWGVGLGMENYFRIVPAVDLVLNFGYDYYFSSTLYGHDTSYSPEGQDVNPREDYTFKDADKAVNQPQHQIKALIGFNYNFN